MDDILVDDGDTQWNDEGTLGETYGERALEHISTNHITARQHSMLEPRIPVYVTLDGVERLAFVQQAFQDVWDGCEIDWAVRSSWPSRRENPQFHGLRKAVRNFFKERGRVRDITVKLPRGHSGKWSPLAVCSEIYRAAIKDLVQDVTGLTPKDKKGGFIAEYPKARKAFYYSLGQAERDELDRISEQWNRTGTPKSTKMKKYKRSCMKLLRRVAHTCLTQYGVYPYFLLVAEPGLNIETQMVDFSPELGLGKALFKNDTVMVNTLSRLESFVRRKAGTTDPQPTKKKKMAKSMDELVTYRIYPDDYMNRNGLKLHRDRFDASLMEKESVNALYYFFSYAHANISPRHPSKLEPPWSAMAKPNKLFDPKYLPEGVTMGEPAKMKLAERMKVLNHILDLGELEFHHWKPRSGDPIPPVDVEMRYWSQPSIDPVAEAFESARAEACAAKPVHFAASRLHGSGRGEGSGPAEQSAAPRGPGEVEAPRATYSPYGGYRAARVHDESMSVEAEFFMPPTFAKIPDPDDLLPEGADLHHLDAPCSVPDNVEAKAQWCWIQASRASLEGKLPASLYKKCLTLLSELPVVHNNYYAASNFRKQKMIPYLPPTVTWAALDLNGGSSASASYEIEAFIIEKPWIYTYKGRDYFTGVEMAWLFMLAILLLLETDPDVDNQNYTTLTGVLKAFRTFLRDAAHQFSYPGIAPSMKYAIVTSRPAYLYHIFQHEDSLVELLALVQRLPVDGFNRGHRHGPSSVPSWQSARLGLTAHMHTDESTVSFFTKWLGRPDRFRDEATESIVSRETGLEYLLLVAFLFADVQSIQAGSWDCRGNLEGSCLRGNEEELSGLITQWASASIVELEDILGPQEESDDDAGSMFGSTEFRGQFRDSAHPGDTGGVPAVPDWNHERAERARTAERSRTAEPVAGPSRQPAAASGTSRRTSTRPPSLDPIYAAAARQAPPDIAELQQIADQALVPPTTQAEQRRHLAFQALDLEGNETARNREIRDANRQRNIHEYGTAVKPPAPKPPRMQTLPTLPPPVEIPELPTPVSPRPAPPAKRKRGKKPVESQDMASVPARAKAPRKTNSARARAPKLKSARAAALKAVGGRRKLPSNKRPKPSEKKKRDEPDSEAEESQAAGSHATGSPAMSVHEEGSVEGGSEAGQPEQDVEMDNWTDEEEESLPLAISGPAKVKVTKRPRAATQSTVNEGSIPASSPPAKRPASKRRRVEVSLAPISFTKPTGTTAQATSTSRSRIRPRMIVQPGSVAANTRAANRNQSTPGTRRVLRSQAG